MLRFVIILAAMLSMMLTPCEAEDFQFVDCRNFTGYYVDMDSVDTESKAIISARIAIKKADANRLLIYDIRFNHVERTYQIVSSKTINYETQEVIDERNDIRDFRGYAPNSEMAELINFIMYGGDLS